MGNIRKIGLVYALQFEAAPLLKQLGFEALPPRDTAVPFRQFRAEWKGLELFASVSGEDSRHGVANVGTNAAVLGTYLLLDSHSPDLLLNPGTAGGFESRGGRIGDVFLGKRDVRFFDRRTPVERYQEYCRGKYPVVSAEGLAKKVGAKLGHVCSGNSFDCPEIDRKHLDENEADLKEMEAAAVGWVAWMKGVPFLPVKAVTDFVEHHETAEAQFLKNYKAACHNLTEVVVKVLGAIAEEGTLA